VAISGLRRVRRPSVYALTLAVALLAAGAAWRIGWHAESVPTETFFSLSLPDADGKRQALAQWKGKVLVVNFWATWCAPCVAEMPELQRLQDEFANRDVAIVCLGTESSERVRQFRSELGLHMILLAGGFDSMAIARNLGNTQGVLPYTVVFSRGGALLRSHVGALQPGQLRGWLDAALNDKPSIP
jgi:thiol-disulfide isomerase/thioredoxin